MAVTFAPCPQQGHRDVPSGDSAMSQRCPAACRQQLSWPVPSTHISPTRSPSPFKDLVDKDWLFTGSGF